MADEFKVGDVVVCVDDSPSCNDGCVGESPVSPIHIGSIHRVTGMVATIEGPGPLIDGEVPHTCLCCEGEAGWNPTRFRKLPSASEEFTVRIRACKPHNTKVPA